jgi:two-component system, NarL family, response regulator DesR
MRPAAPHRDRGDMRTSADHPADGIWPARIVIIDDHEISRAACRALLRTEGLDVVADLAADNQPLAAARALRPDVAIIDVTPAANTGFSIADGLLALPAPPTIILTSSTARTHFGTRLNGHRFIAKAEICAEAITWLARTAGTGRPESPKSRHSREALQQRG